MSVEKPRERTRHKCQFNKDWENHFPVSPVPGDIYAFHCIPCGRNISCSDKGLRSIRRHCQTLLHKKTITTKMMGGAIPTLSVMGPQQPHVMPTANTPGHAQNPFQNQPRPILYEHAPRQNNENGHKNLPELSRENAIENVRKLIPLPSQTSQSQNHQTNGFSNTDIHKQEIQPIKIENCENLDPKWNVRNNITQRTPVNQYDYANMNMSGRAQPMAVNVNEQNQNHLARSQHIVEASSPADINRHKMKDTYWANLESHFNNQTFLGKYKMLLSYARKLEFDFQSSMGPLCDEKRMGISQDLHFIDFALKELLRSLN